MNTEIERKFLVRVDYLPPLEDGTCIEQHYIFSTETGVLRVRSKGAKYYLTVKGAGDISRTEVEFQISESQYNSLIPMSTGVIQKDRYEFMYKGKLWEIDFFKGRLEGLIVAEIELSSESESFTLPPWVDKEVTYDSNYSNNNLAMSGFPVNFNKDMS